MRRASILLAAASLTSLCLEAIGQSVQTMPRSQNGRFADDQVVNVPAPRPFRPKLALQDALKIAEHYIEQQRIDISSFWLYRAEFVVIGDENTPDMKKLPCWHFWWVNESGALGDYVEIVVTMDGRPSRDPSM